MLGTEVVLRSVAAGWDLTVFNRGTTPHQPFPEGVAHELGDRGDADAVFTLAAMEPDAVIDLSSYEPEHVELALQAFSGRCGRYLLMSSGAVYCPQPVLPWAEDTPLGGDPLWGPYGAKKLRNEEIAHEYRDEVPLVLLRPPYIVGLRDHMRRIPFIIDRIVGNGPVLLPDTGRAAIQFVSPSDVARACQHVLQLNVPSPAAFNVALPHWITLAGLVMLIATALGESPRLEPVELATVGLSNAPFAWDDMVFPFADRDFVLDTHKLEASGFRYETPLLDLIEGIVAAYEPGPAKRYPSEDKALQLLDS